MGTSAGSIIAIIITTHMARNDAAALTAKSSAETARKAREDARSASIPRERSSPAASPLRPGSALGILVVAAPPEAGFVASQGGAVQPLVHPPQAVQPARVGG